jgi:hypothetical protein
MRSYFIKIYTLFTALKTAIKFGITKFSGIFADGLRVFGNQVQNYIYWCKLSSKMRCFSRHESGAKHTFPCSLLHTVSVVAILLNEHSQLASWDVVGLTTDQVQLHIQYMDSPSLVPCTLGVPWSRIMSRCVPLLYFCSQRRKEFWCALAKISCAAEWPLLQSLQHQELSSDRVLRDEKGISHNWLLAVM